MLSFARLPDRLLRSRHLVQRLQRNSETLVMLSTFCALVMQAGQSDLVLHLDLVYSAEQLHPVILVHSIRWRHKVVLQRLENAARGNTWKWDLIARGAIDI